MGAENGPAQEPRGQAALAAINRILAGMSPADIREVRLKDLRADVDQSLAEVCLVLGLLARGRASCGPDLLRRLARRMRGAAGSIDLLLDMLAREGGRQ